MPSFLLDFVRVRIRFLGILFLTTYIFSGKLATQVADFSQRDPLILYQPNSVLRPSDTLSSSRFWTALGIGSGLYLGSTYALYQTWYKEFDRGPFRTFNDWPEWLQMDKAGHFFSAYFQSRYSYYGARWTGMSRSGSRWAAIGVSTIIQSTIEVFDGFSPQWGFSWSDIAANSLGTGFFIAQDLLWQEQRIVVKVGNNLRDHPDWPISSNGVQSNLGDISRERFGEYPFERFLKDYNNQSLWLSANLRSFLPQSGIPQWLNLAVGYGAENVYGALGNNWTAEGQSFKFPGERYRQWFISPDIYLSRIPTKKRWVRLVLGLLDIIKVPAPTLELSQGKLKWHWLMW
ncbi:MAG: DUF2279 domain-containing protein [Bacteroidota bacterium]